MHNPPTSPWDSIPPRTASPCSQFCHAPSLHVQIITRQAIQARCRSTLDDLAAKKAARATPTPSPSTHTASQQQEQGAGGTGDADAWGSAVAEAELQEQLDSVQMVLQDQDQVGTCWGWHDCQCLC